MNEWWRIDNHIHSNHRWSRIVSQSFTKLQQNTMDCLTQTCPGQINRGRSQGSHCHQPVPQLAQWRHPQPPTKRRRTEKSEENQRTYTVAETSEKFTRRVTTLSHVARPESVKPDSRMDPHMSIQIRKSFGQPPSIVSLSNNTHSIVHVSTNLRSIRRPYSLPPIEAHDATATTGRHQGAHGGARQPRSPILPTGAMIIDVSMYASCNHGVPFSCASNAWTC